MLTATRQLQRPRGKTLSAEYASWGKVVTKAGGPVAYWSPYGLTSLSSGLSSFAVDALSPEALLGVDRITPDMILADRPGALFARSVDLVSSEGALPPGIAFLRFRFRPEAGEASSGRTYLQARSVVLSREAWLRHGARRLCAALGGLHADPDILKTSTDFDFNAAPLALVVEDDPAVHSTRHQAAERMLHFLTSGDAAGVLELGDESIGDEAEFLSALGWAMEQAQRAFGAVAPFGFSSGCTPRGAERWIRYTPGRRHAIDELSQAGSGMSSELLEWQRLLIDAALSSHARQASLLLDKTRNLSRSLAGFAPAQRDEIEQLLPRRERALFQHFAIAAGLDDPARLTDDIREFSTDAIALIAKFANCPAWKELESNTGRLYPIMLQP